MVKFSEKLFMNVEHKLAPVILQKHNLVLCKEK